MIDWQTFFSVLTALITFRMLQGVPEFIDGFARGWRDSRNERLASVSPATTAGRPEEGGTPPKLRR